MSGAAPHDPYRALREAGFRRYLIGNLIGTIGTLIVVALVAAKWPEVGRLGRLEQAIPAPAQPV